ncbi:MAG: PQQ-binding-like beta-propeller repeat protein, partial [Candidatus Pacearchaeota archaeon]
MVRKILYIIAFLSVILFISLNVISSLNWIQFGYNSNNSRFSTEEINLTIEIKWNYSTENAIFSSPAVVNNILYIGSTDNKTYALNATNGSLIWNYSTENAIFSSPAVVNNILYIGSTDNKTYALNATNGSLIWN